MSTLEHEPWRELSPSVADVIEPELPELRDEILAVIAEEVPEYARPLEGNFGRGLRLGVDEALRQFARLIADPDGGRAQSSEVYRGLGRGEMREGRSLDSLQAAYRVGARVAWRRLSAAGLAAGLPPEVLCLLADAIFAYIDELSADSVEGYAQAQEVAAGERERRRRSALAAVLAEPFEPERLRAAAAEAGWALPGTVALLACDPGDLDVIARRLPIDTLAGTYEELGCVVVPDPDGPGRRGALERACNGRAAALGLTQPLGRASISWARARSGLAAIRGGTLEPELCVVADNLTEIAFFEAREPLRELREKALVPLEGLTPAARERMTDTLKAYLDHRGNAPAMAEALHIHPQTVRYRLRKLRELFGESLDDPEARFELETAVRIPNGGPDP
jgi:PucR-like helix-turn-helix protein